MSAVTGARLRTYNVGFGDCLLLLFDYDDATRRSVLIDFGSTKRPNSAPPSRMLDVAQDIKVQTGGHLDMVVATHRHADHISGFGADDTGALIETLSPEVVVQPWTEEPGLATDALQPSALRADGDSAAASAALADTMARMQAFAAGVHVEAHRLRGDTTKADAVTEQLNFLGATNLRNAAAVTRLAQMGRRAPIYTKFGDDLTDETLLPGVAITVLGPPTLAQSRTIARQARVDKREFWHLAAGWGVATADGQARAADLAPLFPDAVVPVPQAAEWLVPRIERVCLSGAMSLLRTMDGVLNNTSLILLLRIGDTRLLFPGDAQIENWSYALFDAPQHDAIREELAATNLYKVGHHGSLNATPKTLWDHFDRRGKRDRRMISVVSTLAGKHGSYDDRTEVPRTTLIEALTADTDFHTTQFRNGKTKFWVDVDIPLT